MAYPDQPIGVGARWKLERESIPEGLPDPKVTTITLSGTSEHNVEPDPIEISGLPQGTWVNVKSIHGNETVNAKLKSVSFCPTTMQQQDRLTTLVLVGGNEPAKESTYLSEIYTTARLKTP